MNEKLKKYSYYKTTRGMCKTCRRVVNSRVYEKEGRIFQENLCMDCGASVSMIARDKDWYFNHVNFPIHATPPETFHTETKTGCPLDCGLCSWHENGPNLPVFSITNACNLDCPKCFTYNRKDKIYYMSEKEMRETVAFLLNTRAEYDLINITGGEPTLHPNLMAILRIAKNDRIGRITMNSNGMRLAEDEELVRELKKLGVYVILSFDTLSGETSVKIHGKDIVDAKFKALEKLADHNIGVTLLNVMIKGVNDHEIGDIINLTREYSNIGSITIQNMTFTGQGGTGFSPRERLTLDMAMDAIEDRSSGMIRKDHFFPLPSSHPLCYSIGYFFKREKTLQSFTDILSVKELIELIGPYYIIRPDDDFHDALKDAIAKSWADEKNQALLQFIRKLLKRMHPKDRHLTPFERQKIAEKSILTIYIHAHMDEENFDLSRIVSCGDLVPVDGDKLIPACAYNLFYRMKDERFWTTNSNE